MLAANPFIIARLPAAEAFADRVQEVRRIAAAFREPGGKLLVYGDRRLGKSAALHVAAAKARSASLPVAVVDLSTVSGPAEAANQILTAVHRAVGRSWTDLFKAVAKALSVQISATADPAAGGLPTVAVTVASTRPAEERYLLVTDVLTAVEAELRRRGKRLGLALDEFQRIHEWGGEDAEWALKGATERHEAISYVLAGSSRSLIEDMVADKSRALWKLFDLLQMGPIDPVELAIWIRKRARRAGVAMSDDSAQAIVRVAGPRTRDVVQLARHVWARGRPSRRATLNDVAEAMDTLVREQDAIQRRVWATIDATAQDILRLLAADPNVAITSAETLARYDLGAKSSVHRGMVNLVKAELLTVAESGRYLYDDPFFRRWVQLYTLADLGLPTPAMDLGR